MCARSSVIQCYCRSKCDNVNSFDDSHAPRHMGCGCRCYFACENYLFFSCLFQFKSFKRSIKGFQLRLRHGYVRTFYVYKFVCDSFFAPCLCYRKQLKTLCVVGWPCDGFAKHIDDECENFEEMAERCGAMSRVWCWLRQDMCVFLCIREIQIKTHQIPWVARRVCALCVLRADTSDMYAKHWSLINFAYIQVKYQHKMNLKSRQGGSTAMYDRLSP